MASDPKILGKYKAGFAQCANEVAQYLTKSEGFNHDIQNRLINHLSGCVHKIAPAATVAPATAMASTSSVSLPLSGAQPMGIQFPSASATLASASQEHQVTSSHGKQQQTVTQQTMGTAAIGSVIGNQNTLVLNNNNNNIASAAPATSLPTANGVQNVPILPVQLIPAKLPTGDLVFLMANSQPLTTNIVASVPAAQTSGGSAPGASSNASAVAIVTPQVQQQPQPSPPSQAETQQQLSPIQNAQETAGMKTAMKVEMPAAPTCQQPETSPKPSSIVVPNLLPPNQLKNLPTHLPFSALYPQSLQLSSSSSSTLSSIQNPKGQQLRDEKPVFPLVPPRHLLPQFPQDNLGLILNPQVPAVNPNNNHVVPNNAADHNMEGQDDMWRPW